MGEANSSRNNLIDINNVNAGGCCSRRVAATVVVGRDAGATSAEEAK
ncbi:MAG: hypothetical protein IJ635_04180 [Bacteroidaceae bacterium]|nr:hypothetical protein [Bacteroidaceae bacterium]